MTACAGHCSMSCGWTLLHCLWRELLDLLNLALFAVNLPGREVTVVLACLPWLGLFLDICVSSVNWVFKKALKKLIDSTEELPQSYSSALRPRTVKLSFVTEIIIILAGNLAESFKERQSGRTPFNGPINLSIISSTGNIEGRCWKFLR